MAPRTTYASLTDGLQLLSLWDQSLADAGSLGTTPCTATGTNAISLTPVTAAFAPTASYSNLRQYRFAAAGTSSGAVTIQVGALASVILYKADGVTQAGSGDIVSGTYYTVAANTAGTGMVITGSSSSVAAVPINTQAGTAYTIQASDSGQLIVSNNPVGGAFALTLPQAIGAFAGISFWVQNLQAGTTTITPTAGTINGFASYILLQGQLALVKASGGNYTAVTTAQTLFGDGTTNQPLITSVTINATPYDDPHHTFAPNTFYVNSYLSNHEVSALRLLHFCGGPVFTGGAEGVHNELILQFATSVANPDASRIYVGTYSISAANVEDRGTVGTPRGMFFGHIGQSANGDVTGVTFGAQYPRMLIGTEGQAYSATGSSPHTRIGVSAVDYGSGAQATAYDIGVNVGAAYSTSIGWKYAFAVSPAADRAFVYNFQPLSATGTILATIGTGTVANGIDFSSYTFTGNEYNSANFQITGAGAVQTKTGNLTVGTISPASGTSRAIIVNGAAAGTGAGSNLTGINGGSSVWSVGNSSSVLGTAYDSTLMLFHTSAAYRFNGLTAGLLASSANGTVSVDAVGTGVVTALAVNVGTAGAFVVNGGALGSPSSVGTMPAFTLGGTIAGGGSQINNVIIGAATPLAGSFTTVSGSTSVTSPIVAGGSAPASTLTLQSTSGAGTTDSMLFQTGSQVLAGKIDTNQQWVIGKALTPLASGPPLTVNRNASATPSSFSGISGASSVVAHLIGVDASNATVAIQAYGSGNNPGVLYLQARGTQASPTATQSGDFLGINFAYGYATSGGAGYVSNAGAGFQMIATETYTSTAGGAKLVIVTTPTGTATTATAATFQASGGLSIGTATDPGIGGFQANAQMFLPNITTTSAAQTGTVCWTTGTGKFTVDTTVGCLTSLEEAKNISRRLDPPEALALVSELRPFSFRYRDGWGDGGRYEQFGLGAHQVASVDERLAGRDTDGNLRGVRYQELTAVLVGAIQQLKADNDDLCTAIGAITRRQ